MKGWTLTGLHLGILCWGDEHEEQSMQINLPRPMTHITALEASSWIPGVFCSPATSVGKLHANFVAHEMSFMILGDTFFRSLATVEFLSTRFRNGRKITKQVHTTKPYPILEGLV
jgi:hypothetical protein